MASADPPEEPTPAPPARALFGQAAPQRLLLLPLVLGVAQLDCLDLAVALLAKLLALRLLRPLVQGQVEAQAGQAVQGTHHVFPMISEVTERTVQGVGSSCATRQGGCREPRR